MFGQDNTKDQNDQAQQPADTVVAPTEQSFEQAVAPTAAAPAADGADPAQWQHPGQPLDSTGNPTPAAPAADDATAAPAPAATPHDLIDIKQKALQQLSPLVGHLEQSPEEKFRTTMMMIQASDDQSLVQDAYAAAEQIEDEKTRAQALLDIVNEINYFTSQHQD